MNPMVPMLLGWSSGMTPLPWNVLATWMPNSSENRTSAAVALARAAPCPASSTGRLAEGRRVGADDVARQRRQVVVGVVGVDVLWNGEVDRGRTLGLGDLERL